MKNWQSVFEEPDLDNGYTLFIEKHVHEFLFTQEQITAKVTEENNEYDILIQLTTHEHFYRVACTCSHEGNDHCAHIAAVLFKYEQEDKHEKTPDLIKLISYANEQDIHDFLLSILRGNQKLTQRFQEHIAIKNISDYDKMVVILEKHTQYSTNNTNDRTIQKINNELSGFLTKLVDTAVEKNQILHAFELMNRVVEHLDLAKIHNVENDVSLIMHQCYSLWKKLLKHASEQEKQRMFSKLSAKVNSTTASQSCFYIQQVLHEEFPQQFSDHEQQALDQTTENNGFFNYKNKRLLSIRQMENLNYSDNQIRQRARESWQSPTIRSQYIDYLMQKKAYEEAIVVLKESIVLDKHSSDMITLHRYALKNLYHKLGNKELYAEQIFHLLLEGETVDMNLIHQLKKSYSIDQWEEVREQLFEQLKNRTDVGLFYSKERRYDLLLDYILKSPGLEEASRYFSFLRKQFPEALLQKYEYELRRMAAETTTRSRYHKMALLIAEMATLPSSTISVQLLIKELKEKYPRRKAMLEELKKLEKNYK
ncbi:MULTISPECIES: SWIM zinc finger family protein [unclassified Enterococcus]|uniref:SWIM zinc finger family protein n=1 Tax=unclassified Enterococcus TaxID=2608891 RepID=UPI001A90DFC6|nr:MULTISPECIES: hypothetical protein [unclassified Enterococcus]MBO0461694.1 hypothetical protein [Enterococcus sp. DIV1298c]MBO1298978.1 hypothetical protein [Enterococcus sp. DIV1271a]